MGVAVKIRTATWSAVSLGAALAMCLAGCTSSGSKAPTGPTGGSSSTTTQSVVTSAESTTSTAAVTSTGEAQATTSPSATTTTGAAKASQRCTTSQLDITTGPVGAGLGHAGIPVRFRNTGASACTMSGYPGVAGLDAKGSQVVQAQRTPNGYLGGLAQGVTTPPVVTLTNGQVASALIEGSSVPLDNATSCPTFPALLVTAPGETHSVRVAADMPGCTGIAVHPIVAGSTGSQS
jgi:hypothetical protein